ncbi:MAG: hypothetical protein Q4A32_00845 [Lachnospiraceae bacterium]|nr:hypothetical protein [Lachnospiraceae bacterium]
MEKAYKMFNKDLTCTMGRGTFQYKPGVWYEEMEREANCIANGFHAAKNPLDCLSYYPNFANSQCWLVEIDGDIDEDARDSKVSAQKIRLVRRLSLPEFVCAASLYIISHPDMDYGSHVTVNRPAVANRNHFAIAVGECPIAKGNKGDVIALLRTGAGSRKVVESNCFEIDDVVFKSGVWYGVEGTEVRDDKEE